MIIKVSAILMMCLPLLAAVNFFLVVQIVNSLQYEVMDATALTSYGDALNTTIGNLIAGMLSNVAIIIGMGFLIWFVFQLLFAIELIKARGKVRFVLTSGILQIILLVLSLIAVAIYASVASLVLLTLFESLALFNASRKFE